MIVASNFDYRYWQKLATPVMGVAIVLLIVVLFMPKIAGVHRWIPIGNLTTFQPSEIAKFAVVILFAKMITIYGEKMKTFRYGILPFLIVLGVISGLMVLEPHLSGTILILTIGIVMMFVGGVDLKWFVLGVAMMENLRAAGREDSVFLQWTGQLADLNRKQLEFQVSVTYFNLLPSFLNAVGNVLILCVGAWLIMNGDLTLGGMFAFQTLTASFTAPFTALMMSGAELQTMKADVERINDVYKYEPEKSFRADDGSERVPPDHAVFEMKNVTFGYSRQEPPVLEDFSLKVTPGKRVALVGASGSGKTTVAKLANGTLLPWSGEILLNGKPMNEYTRSEYYATVGTVDQSIMLFSGTVGQNLTLFAPSYEARDLQQAVRDAAIEQELTARGPMLELNVEEGGNNFSGGQRQRLEIARALTYRTPLLILDEATSALDPVTEVEIDKAIRRRGCACIVVAHRLSTIRDCDEIIMLDHGIVAERGTHEVLMAAGGKYAAMMKLEQGG